MSAAARTVTVRYFAAIREALGTGLGHKGFFIAGQARQVDQCRSLGALQRLGRQVNRELHRQTDFPRAVLVEALCTAEAGVGIEKVEGRVGHETHKTIAAYPYVESDSGYFYSKINDRGAACASLNRSRPSESTCLRA